MQRKLKYLRKLRISVKHNLVNLKTEKDRSGQYN